MWRSLGQLSLWTEETGWTPHNGIDHTTGVALNRFAVVDGLLTLSLFFRISLSIDCLLPRNTTDSGCADLRYPLSSRIFPSASFWLVPISLSIRQVPP